MQALQLSPSTKDIAFRGGQLATLDGQARLAQDLRIFLVEQLNSDPYIQGVGTDLMVLIPDMGGYGQDQAAAMIRIEVADAIRRYHEFQVENLSKMRRRPWIQDSDFMAQMAQMRDELISEVSEIQVDFDGVDPRRIGVAVRLLTEADLQLSISGISLTL